jgi:hypothetical protein
VKIRQCFNWTERPFQSWKWLFDIFWVWDLVGVWNESGYVLFLRWINVSVSEYWVFDWGDGYLVFRQLRYFVCILKVGWVYELVSWEDNKTCACLRWSHLTKSIFGSSWRNFLFCYVIWCVNWNELWWCGILNESVYWIYGGPINLFNCWKILEG